jgi:hypothetical protein
MYTFYNLHSNGSSAALSIPSLRRFFAVDWFALYCGGLTMQWMSSALVFEVELKRTKPGKEVDDAHTGSGKFSDLVY